MDIDIPKMDLKTDAQMPKFGLGTWQLTGDTCVKAVDAALRMGYDHIDTADVYGNHREVAAGMADHDREGIWITSKVNKGDLQYDDVLATCEKNLEELEVDYIDLYLIHWPDPSVPMEETFRALRRLRDEGMVNEIGVSNFMVEHLTEAVEVAELPIVNNQIKFHPTHQPWDVVEMCREHDIAVTAYSPLAHGEIFGNETMRRIADELDRTVAQVSLRWLLQSGIEARAVIAAAPVPLAELVELETGDVLLLGDKVTTEAQLVAGDHVVAAGRPGARAGLRAVRITGGVLNDHENTLGDTADGF